jgi:hypothetical protein
MNIRDQCTSAAHYDQWMGRWSRLLAQEFVMWLNLPAGLRWIDVCCPHALGRFADDGLEN